MGDRDLIERCVQGDRRAWSDLFRRYDAKILRASGPDAADLRQEVWARLVERNALSRLRLERPGALDAWFARVAGRVAVDQRRRRRARPPEEPFDVDPPESSLDPETAAMRAEEVRALFAAARGRVRSVLRLHLVEGLGPREIAASGIGLSPKGVASLLRRTVSRLAPEVARGRPPQATAGNRRRGP